MPANAAMELATSILDALPDIVLALVFSWIIWKLFNIFKPRNEHSLRSVAIIVLGDIGRSPRMMYHAQSFAENHFVTDIIGYNGSKPIPELERLPRVHLHYLPSPPKFASSLPFVLMAPIKVVHQMTSILWLLLVQIQRAPEFLLVQNPPTIPTLALVWLVGRIRGSKVIIDWHNLGYSILALKLGPNHPFVRISAWFEEYFGRCAYAHLFVTRAMRDHLAKKWKLVGKQVVLYDRPPRRFHRSSAQETHDLFIRLQPTLLSQSSLHNFLPDSTAPYSTPFTQIVQTHERPSTIWEYAKFDPKLRRDRPALLVSSTSWTPDEDFGILLEALDLFDTAATRIDANQKDRPVPKVLVVITGKGPLKKKYMAEVDKLHQRWKWVRCISMWLEAEDYPTLLGSADLGVCLHSSSSGLDLPMKVVDMFGCGLPVCALDFSCLRELVKDGINGLIFKDAPQLAKQIETLLIAFPDSSDLSRLQTSLLNLSQSSSLSTTHSIDEYRHADTTASDWHWKTWDENWNHAMKPIILSDLNR